MNEERLRSLVFPAFVVVIEHEDHYDIIFKEKRVTALDPGKIIWGAVPTLLDRKSARGTITVSRHADFTEEQVAHTIRQEIEEIFDGTPE